ncbi:MAG: peroxiredoxin family protein [Acidimicrobiales bacterium]|nr:TlpA family protein disulfide reductase [Actinomycetota bacterium]
MLAAPGVRAPSFTLNRADSGRPVSDPWDAGAVVLAFFKVTCPTCQLAAPKVQALSDAGVRVTAIGEDPPPALAKFAQRFGQRVPTLTEPAPYPVSRAYGISAVPTLVLVGEDGVVQDAVPGWDRDGWNRLAAAAGAPPVSVEGDGLPSFRPG